MMKSLLRGAGLSLLLVVFLMAVIDVPLQAFLFKSRLKMSHEEVKQEHKESDGNPQIKGKIRQKQREMADGATWIRLAASRRLLVSATARNAGNQFQNRVRRSARSTADRSIVATIATNRCVRCVYPAAHLAVGVAGGTR